MQAKGDEYRKFLRGANQFAAYNFREYSRRRARDAFRQHRCETDPARIQALLARGREDLLVLQVAPPPRSTRTRLTAGTETVSCQSVLPARSPGG